MGCHDFLTLVQMISVERVIKYCGLKSEASLETLPPQQQLPPDWPNVGGIVFSDISFRYSEELPLVLKNLSFSINPAEKVLIIVLFLA